MAESMHAISDKLDPPFVAYFSNICIQGYAKSSDALIESARCSGLLTRSYNNLNGWCKFIWVEDLSKKVVSGFFAGNGIWEFVQSDFIKDKLHRLTKHVEEDKNEEKDFV